MRGRSGLVAAVAVWTAFAGAAMAEPAPPTVGAGVVDLACTGPASYPVRGKASGEIRGEADGGVELNASGTAVTDETFVFRIEGDAMLVKLPVATAAWLRGKDLPGGWRPMKDVRIGDDRITGRFVYNTLNHVDVAIDRRSGEAEAKAIGFQFRGACEASRVDPAARRF